MHYRKFSTYARVGTDIRRHVVAGRVKTQIGAEIFVLGPGDVARHPAGVSHNVEALVHSTAIQVKSPVPDLASFIGTDPPSRQGLRHIIGVGADREG